MVHIEAELEQDYLVKRGEWYHYRRRVPSWVSHIDQRKEVKISLKSKDAKQALIRADIYNEQIESYWKALLQSGEHDSSLAKYKAAVHIAKTNGFAYKSTSQIAVSTLNELMDRLNFPVKNEEEIHAIFGGAEFPELRLASCIEPYFNLVVDRLAGKSEHKIKKWKNPRKLALNNFIKVIGNKDVKEVVRADILNFRGWLRQRIVEGISADFANKQLRYVKDILCTISIENELNIDFEPLFTKTRFQYIYESRPPFKASYVQEVLIPSLEGLNKRDRMVMYALADTGARISEIFGLSPQDIFLDGDIPYIEIRPRENYTLKTRHSQRQIPLVGAALIAFKEFQNGFNIERNPDTFSNIANNYLTDNDLKPTPRHSVYSLRHTFKDRLRDAEAPEEIIDDLMGHKKSGPKYGRGHRLDAKQKWLSSIAYTT